MEFQKKVIILVGDGMADYPIEALGGKTPLEIANTPNMDYAAVNGILGLVKTIPDGMKPGSDTANLSIFGYDPLKYYSGRAPLEAVNMRIEMGTNDVAIRCNFVNIQDNIMTDFTADHITSELGKVVIEELNRNINIKGIEFFSGVSYRNIVIWRDFPYKEIPVTTPPHDIQGENIIDHLPKGDGADLLNKIMDESKKIFQNSAVIKDGKSRFNGNPTSLWLWGTGRRVAMDPLRSRFGLVGYTISAVDLIHGIGRAVGLSPLHVNGVTGYLDTNYKGKADALIKAIEDVNFIYLHVESPDESGHEGNIDHKIQAIEDFDKWIVGPVIERMRDYDNFSILILPDHPTPIVLKTHTADPVPFCIYSSKNFRYNSYLDKDISGFNEKSALDTEVFIEEGHRLLEIMITGRI
ncbi:MAG: cofactor-independent phosphoglycerate mutase [Spirochaetota bacterium]|nr:cofactor-independent phosphoglycerate mutase [Spirochaetota bacterium]